MVGMDIVFIAFWLVGGIIGMMVNDNELRNGKIG